MKAIAHDKDGSLDVPCLREISQPVIDKTCCLDQTPAALSPVETGHARGKVIVLRGLY